MLTRWKKVSINERLDAKNNELREVKERLDFTNKEYLSLESISNNSVDKKEAELIKLFHEKEALKEQLEIKIKSINKESNWFWK